MLLLALAIACITCCESSDKNKVRYFVECASCRVRHNNGTDVISQTIQGNYLFSEQMTPPAVYGIRVDSVQADGPVRLFVYVSGKTIYSKQCSQPRDSCDLHYVGELH